MESARRAAADALSPSIAARRRRQARTSFEMMESPRGEIGCYLVSDGGPKPYRLHVRTPSFVNLQAMPLLMRGASMSDAITMISTVDPVLGEVDR